MNNVNHSHIMQPEKTDAIALLIKGLIKIAPPFIVGLTAKVANDLNEGRKLSFTGWTVIACLTLSGTFISNWMCEYYSLNKNATLIINAFSTMFSEQIFKLAYHNFFRIAGSWAKENLKISLKLMGKMEGEEDEEAAAKKKSLADMEQMKRDFDKHINEK